jgi:hypothetical protein
MREARRRAGRSSRPIRTSFGASEQGAYGNVCSRMVLVLPQRPPVGFLAEA